MIFQLATQYPKQMKPLACDHSINIGQYLNYVPFCLSRGFPCFIWKSRHGKNSRFFNLGPSGYVCRKKSRRNAAFLRMLCVFFKMKSDQISFHCTYRYVITNFAYYRFLADFALFVPVQRLLDANF